MHNNILSNEERDILNRCKNLINKWATDTENIFYAEQKENGINTIFITSLTVSLTYANAIIILLENNMCLPAQALLRSLTEFTLKIIWCVSDSEDNFIMEKIKRWGKSSAVERKQLLGKLGNIEGYPEDTKREIQKRYDNYRDLLQKLKNIKEMPKFAHIVESMNNDEIKRLAAQCYTNLNKAVHIDITTLTETGDCTASIETLATDCWVLEKCLIHIIRSKYGWDTKELSKTKLKP